MDLVFKCPINALSFGNVSFNLLKAMFRANMNIAVFPHGDITVDSYGQQSNDFKVWLEEAINKRYLKVDRDVPTLQMWHLNGSENRITSNQTLYTFYELDSPTEVELNLARLQDSVVFSSKSAKKHFSSDSRLEGSVHNAPLGFDTDFHKVEKTYMPGKVHFGLMGKFEKRKHTAKIIKGWIKRYGNNYNYQLTCCITNPFYKKEQMESEIANILEGKRYGNVNFLPFMPQNAQVNDYLNSINIDLGGLSGAEGWNLPSFNATCLGKWSVVLNASSHRDWATKENSILLDPNGKEPVYDNIFFKEGADFNQGSIYTFDEDEMIFAMEKAETLCNQENTEGLKLAKEFTYDRTLKDILSSVKKNS